MTRPGQNQTLRVVTRIPAEPVLGGYTPIPRGLYLWTTERGRMVPLTAEMVETMARVAIVFDGCAVLERRILGAIDLDELERLAAMEPTR